MNTIFSTRVLIFSNNAHYCLLRFLFLSGFRLQVLRGHHGRSHAQGCSQRPANQLDLQPCPRKCPTPPSKSPRKTTCPTLCVTNSRTFRHSPSYPIELFLFRRNTARCAASPPLGASIAAFRARVTTTTRRVPPSAVPGSATSRSRSSVTAKHFRGKDEVRDWRDVLSESAGSMDITHGAVDTAVVYDSTELSARSSVICSNQHHSIGPRLS